MTRSKKTDEPAWFRFQWERALLRLDLPGTTKLVALALATYADGETGEDIHPGEDRLAADCGLSDRVIRRHLATLRTAGLIERTARGVSNQYRRAADEYALRLPDDLTERVALTPNHPALDDRRYRTPTSGSNQ